METKRCSRCNEQLPLSMFYRDKQKSDGLALYCKKCNAELKGQEYTPKEEWTEGHRRCVQCEIIKPLEEFHKAKGGRFGRNSVCKQCRSHAKPKPQPREGYLICYKCGQEKPATPEYFRQQSQAKSGLMSHCRVCAREEAKIWRKTKLEEDPDYVKRTYWKHFEVNRQRSRQYYQANIDVQRQKRREWYWNNRERVQQYIREYYYQNRDVFVERVRQWRRDNQGRYRNYNRQWAEANPDKHRAIIRSIWARRRARKHQLPEDFTMEDWLYCLEYWNHQCAVCGSDGNLHADHWIALSDDDCPGTVVDNMLVLCEHCNQTKAAMKAGRWLTQKLGDDAAEKLAEIEAYFRHVKERKSE